MDQRKNEKLAFNTGSSLQGKNTLIDKEEALEKCNFKEVKGIPYSWTGTTVCLPFSKPLEPKSLFNFSNRGYPPIPLVVKNTTTSCRSCSLEDVKDTVPCCCILILAPSPLQFFFIRGTVSTKPLFGTGKGLAYSKVGLFYVLPFIRPLEPKDHVLYCLRRTRSTKFPNGVKGFDFAGREYPVLDTIRCIRKDNLSQIPLY